MKAITADKLVSTGRILIFSVLILLPLNASAEYYLVYGGSPVVCDACQSPRPYYRYYRPTCKVHKVRAHTHRKYYYRRVYHRRSHYTMTVYYPAPCGGCHSCSCGGFMEPTYYQAPAPYGVYYAYPEDRLVGNRYEDYYDPSLDTGTADNDIE